MVSLMRLQELDTDNITSQIYCSDYSWYVQWFNEDTEESSFWYGSKEKCLERLRGPIPPPEDFARVEGFGAGPYDSATATGMHDRDF